MEYLLCEKEMKDGESNTFTAYGVVFPNGERRDDIPFNKKAAEELVRQLNDNNVSVCHAMDVIESFIFDGTTLEIKRYE